MARVSGGAVLVLFVLAFMVASAAAETTPKCCQHFHQWGPPNQKPGCKSPDQNEACNDWCQSTCRGGECKIRDGGKHVCHCYC